MEIRALTGFDETVRKKYGRSYSPLSGTALGSHRLMTDEEQYFEKTFDPNINLEKKSKFDNPNEIFEEVSFDPQRDLSPFPEKKLLPPPNKAGFNPKTLIGVGVTAAIMLSLYLSLNKK